MKIQQNMDVQNNIIKDQADVNSASKSTRKNKNSAVVSGAALKENSPLSQRQSLAKRKALKVVSDAFGGEKKEEKKEEAERLEKEAMQQEMIENIKERAADVSSGADIKRAMARRERAEADSIGAENAQKTIISDAGSIEDTQNAVNTEITNILNKLSLLSNDVKGSTVDTQI